MLSVLMPVYNERATIAQAISSVLSTKLSRPVELVIVDDGSTDGTREILRANDWGENVRVIEHDHNQGKGAAVRTAIQAATGEYSAIFDADLEYKPEDLQLLLDPLETGETNAVFGVRAFDGNSSHSFLYVLGNKSVTLAANLLFNVYLGDLMTCHKMIRTEIFQNLHLTANDFAIEPEIAGRLLKLGERIYEVPVHYRARPHSAGKKLTTRDGFSVLRMLLRCRLTSPKSKAV